MKTIRVDSLADQLSKKPESIVLDVRTVPEFEEVHVPQARSIPLDSLDAPAFLRAGNISADEPVYLLCRSGQRAEKAASKFTAAGFENAIVVSGGTQAWVAANLPVVRGQGNFVSLERQVRIAAGSLVLTGFLLGWFVNRAFFGLSGFVGAGLIFAGVTDWCGMGLLLAKAPWNKRSAA